MKRTCVAAGRNAAACGWILASVGLALAVLMPGIRVEAQTSDVKSGDAPHDEAVYETIHLNYVTEPRALYDLQNCLRNMLPGKTKIFALASQNALTIRGTAEDVAMAKKIVAELDRPRPVYRLTFTLMDTGQEKSDGGKTYSLTALSGEKAELNRDMHMAITHGQPQPGPSAPSSDERVEGLSIEMTADAVGDGVRLHSKVVDSGIADGMPGANGQEAGEQRTVLEGTNRLALGKPWVLGSMGSEQVSVVVERAR